jgi:hypothetical protein
VRCRFLALTSNAAHALLREVGEQGALMVINLQHDPRRKRLVVTRWLAASM